MTDYYPIVKVNPEWAVGQEAMGTKSKFWYRQPGQDESEWLFKHPRKNSGEHWAEKIAAEVAAVLEIPHARVELAELEPGSDGLPPERGSVSESFLEAGTRLTHGNEIMALAFPGYDPDLRFHQSSHALGNILTVLFQLGALGVQGDRLIPAMCEYLILDAIIGNTDRHHENWGLLPVRMQHELRLNLAPTFDHASSLGRELSDARRERMLSEDAVGRYSERGRGGIYWSKTDPHGPSPLQLVRLAARETPSISLPVLRRIESLGPSAFDAIVGRVPPGWMSEASRKFAVALMDYNWRELKKLLEEVSPCL